ncbi:hypothetical protein [Hyalangium versicolor]|uniref:hypothetical protein n=1 Tax=Hyalangium versicolor TaxID=2861190 RepID=UPI001CCF29A3|nr:hypothetical protein [Hyalangium versicolor]
MTHDEWNKEDGLELRLCSSANPLGQGFTGLEPVLDIIEATGEEFHPKDMTLKRRLKYSRSKLRDRLPEVTFQGTVMFLLGCARFPSAYFNVSSSLNVPEEGRFSLSLHANPFSIFTGPGKAEERARRIVELARAFAARFPVSYGFAHSGTDFVMGGAPRLKNTSAPLGVHQTHWLNLFGPRMVEQLGRQRVLSTPAFLVEELPHGAVLLLTRPTPSDFFSEEARFAQARALVHLRPELKLEDTLTALRQRSLAFTPIEPDFDPDIADLLTLTLQRSGLDTRRADIERLNRYRPLLPSEWLPAREVPPSDVLDVAEAIRIYEHQYAEQLAVLLHTKVPSVMDASPESLPELDYFLWWQGWGSRLPEAERELFTTSLGAYLGALMVRNLGGRWVPRRNLDEAAVITGARAWLPFLRARHALQSRQAALDFSLTQFYRHAARRVISH